jgi:RND family efflux transporter MFP subunit
MTATATLLPPRRPELVVHLGMVEDPITGEFYKVGPEESFLLLGLDGRRSAADLTAEFEGRFGAPLPESDLNEFLGLVRDCGFIRSEADAFPPMGQAHAGYATVEDEPQGQTDPQPVRPEADPAVISQNTEPKADVPPAAVPLPARRPDLIVKPSGDGGGHVVKDPRTGQFFDLGPEESFLLLGLDGRQTGAELAAAFEARFGSPLPAEDLEDFLGLARSLGFVTTAPAGAAAVEPAPAPPAPARRQSILYWRKSLFDPDRLFNWLEPRLRFVWTRSFFVVSALALVLAVGVSWSSRAEMVSKFPQALHWQTLVLAWVALVAATTCHEFAHGLTCKHHGGEVHEVGILLMYFMPCFYCNVSDAWLFKERWKRLLVTFAGGYCDLVVWSLSVFVWRVSLPGTTINHIAWVVMTVCGGRVLINCNPLLKLDGYYLLGDATGMPNLMQRGREALMGRVRWLLWGAQRPAPEPRTWFLILYGLATWLYAMVFVTIMLVALARYLSPNWGWHGLFAVALLVRKVSRRLVRGVSNGEVIKMIVTRRKRAATWAVILAAAAGVACVVDIDHQASGPFLVRPLTHAEVHAPVAGFLREVPLDEGDRVSSGGVIVRIEVPDLDSKIKQKRTEIEEGVVHVNQAELDVRTAKDDFARANRLYNTGTQAMSEVEFRNTQNQMNKCASELDKARAVLARAKEELNYLEGQSVKQVVNSPASGLIVTPHLKEKIGQFVHEGDLICIVEESNTFQAEVKLPEQEVGEVLAGQRVELKARALPFELFAGSVEKTAPAATAAAPGEVQSTVTVYCRIETEHPGLRPGMTGQARIHCGRHTIARTVVEKVLRFVRTEFWW